MTISDYTSEIPYGYCQCGCGQKTKIAKQTTNRYGHVRGEPVKYIVGHSSKRTIEKSIQIFWMSVNKDGSIPVHMPHLGKCWEWKAVCHKHGYGMKKWYGRQEQAHRVSWMITNGEIPDGLFVLHECDNPKCVRPDHLRLGTHQDNMDDREQKGRHNPVKGENCYNAKLTDLQVIEIRTRWATHTITQVKLASEYGVSFQLISDIVNYKRWKHIP